MSKEKLCVVFNGADYSLPMSDLIKRPSTITLDNTNYLYVGFKKPLNKFYFNLSNLAPVANTILTVEENDGTNWNPVTNLEDNTYNFSESGYLCWDKYSCNTKCVKSTISGMEKYWYRIQLSESQTIEFMGTGVLFSQDSDVYIEYPILDNAKYKVAVSGNQDNYTNIHVQVRDYILSDIRSIGINKYTKDNPTNCDYFKQITEFDLFDLEEIKFAARMLALANIYYKLSDSPDDRWQIDADRYKAEYLRAFNVAFLSIDKNDDGKQDTCEQPTFTTNLRIKR